MSATNMSGTSKYLIFASPTSILLLSHQPGCQVHLDFPLENSYILSPQYTLISLSQQTQLWLYIRTIQGAFKNTNVWNPPPRPMKSGSFEGVPDLKPNNLSQSAYPTASSTDT